MKSATRHTLLIAGLLGLWASAFAAGHDPGKGDKLKMMDTDGNGQVSGAEHAAGAQKMFTGMDSNKDGFVTAAEMDAAHHGKPPMQGEMTSAGKIKTLDTDGDGKLSAAEHAAGSQKMFSASDANGDGSVDAAEMQAAHDRLMTRK